MVSGWSILVLGRLGFGFIYIFLSYWILLNINAFGKVKLLTQFSSFRSEFGVFPRIMFFQLIRKENLIFKVKKENSFGSIKHLKFDVEENFAFEEFENNN